MNRPDESAAPDQSLDHYPGQISCVGETLQIPEQYLRPVHDELIFSRLLAADINRGNVISTQID
jgi:hypothetical protein